MSNASDLVIREATERDTPALSAFMQAQKQPRSSVEYLRHWYFHAPVKGGTVIVGERDGAVIGMATMTAHRFQQGHSTALVAMPQKVLTDSALRGQGIFGKLYRASESACLEKGADFFLTVTNAASTDIFLNKFGYVRLPSPRMAVMLPLFGKVETRSPIAADVVTSTASKESDVWRMMKDSAHHQWRFIDHPLREYVMASCSMKGEELGVVFLKRIKKKGVPVMLLLDMVPRYEARLPQLLRAARKLTWKHRAFALLCLHEETFAQAIKDNSPIAQRSSGFNFLVKGKDDAHTRELASQRFEISFGDLDFF